MTPEKRPIEQETVRTTIVGGRPPGSGQPLGPIPRGIEVLVKKAAVDAEFKRLLLEKRAEAAKEIGLVLDPAEAMMLVATPRAQLETIIAQTNVSPSLRAAFLGRAAAVMLVALGAGTLANGALIVQPDEPSVTSTAAPTPTVVPPPPPSGVSRGARPDKPPMPPVIAPAPTPTAPAVAQADADAMKTRIEKEYLPAVLEAIRVHRAGGKPLDFILLVDAKGANDGYGYFNAADSGDTGLAGDLSPLFKSWTFPNLSRAGAVTVSIKTAEEPAITPAASTSKLPAAGGARPDRPLPAVKLVSLTVVPGVVAPPAPAPTPTATPTAPAPTPTFTPVPKGLMADRPPAKLTPPAGGMTVTRPVTPPVATFGIQPDTPIPPAANFGSD
jgi:hypothetical protein